MVDKLTARQARHIIEVVGASGTPPEWGFQFFSAGLDGYLKVIEDDYLKSFIQDGGSSFKVVVGTYGGGKTHFLYSIRELAWRHDYLVTYCPLSAESSPFHRLDMVYKSIAVNLMRPLSPDELLTGGERGLGAFIKAVYADMRDALGSELTDDALVERIKTIAADSVRGCENPNFGKAVRLAIEALADGNRDQFDTMLQYLTVDGWDRAGHKSTGVLQPIERSQAFATIRSLVSWVRNLRFKGIIILFDEAEQAGAMTSRQKEMMLANLREMVDQCGGSSFANTMVFYAIPNEQFLTEGRSPAYEALRQRIQTVFDYTNPTGVKIRLDRITRDPKTLMLDIGRKLCKVYETAYAIEIPAARARDVVAVLAAATADRAFGDIGYKRLFVQALVRALHAIRFDPDLSVDEDFAMRMLSSGDGDVLDDIYG
ncbi:MAG TPA: DUF2791 family P-loop domain-containing protein [Myxococcota bacterium]|nr:DUF2791 family P-loop domain-containing protein [Myxococcota bacterium]HOD07651.1 DUF2791 family P-loop domain-containing protein [Myxococcota bacterium]HPB49877.1 DUF2791 family P-loop domain-containing protein [Myxococcota bacterium]HQP94838.1 DUF2791 family P-loop domain-containing protein [Myxococcota bacterium]